MPKSSTLRVGGREVSTGHGISVVVRQGRIAAIEPRELTSGPWLAAGLIDLQVNGFRGLDLNDGAVTPARVKTLSRLMAGLGVTIWLPTLITASQDSLLSALAAIAGARRQDPLSRG